MQLVEYYHQLQVELSAGAREERPVTLEELAGILYCSERNVKIILKKMSDLNWIRWKPGRGRGNRSALELLVPSEGLLLEEARKHVKEGNVKAAMEYISLKGFPAAKKEEFLEWLSGYFGYQEVGEREKKLDTLRLPSYSPILTLDPAEILFVKDLHLVKQIFDTLVRFDPKDRTIRPHLAHYWESNREGTLWTFYLRKGVRFHHGRELTAEDAVFTLNRLKKLEHTATNGWLAGPIRQALALSPYTVRVELHSPNYMFLHYLSAAGTSIVPRDVYEQGLVNTDRYPIGTGPFRVAKHDDCVCALDAHQDYFLGRALLDRVETWNMPGDCKPSVVLTADVEMASSGGCDGVEVVPGYCPDCKTITTVEKGCTFLTFNMRRDGPHRHRSFREAVHRLIDRTGMARELGSGNMFPANGFLPPDTLAVEDPDYDPDRAAALLREAEYNGEPFRIQLTLMHKPSASWIAERLGGAGIRVELDFVNRAEAGIMEKLMEAHCFFGGVVADEDLEFSLLEMYRVGKMPLRSYFDDGLMEELNRRIDAILREPSEAGRPARIRELEQTLKQDYYALFFLHQIVKTSFSSIVNGVALNSLGMVNFKDLWFQPTPARRIAEAVGE